MVHHAADDDRGGDEGGDDDAGDGGPVELEHRHTWVADQHAVSPGRTGQGGDHRQVEVHDHAAKWWALTGRAHTPASSTWSDGGREEPHSTIPRSGGADAGVVAWRSVTLLPLLRRCSRWNGMSFQLGALMSAVMACYGVSFFFNSIASRFVAVPNVWSLLLLNTSGRAVTLLVIILLLWMLRWRPAAGAITFSRPFLTAASVPVMGHCGFIAYFALISHGATEVSILVPMIGLYSLVPTAVGLLYRGDRRHCTKLMGIALSVAALLLLGFAGNESDGGLTGTASSGPTDASALVKKALLFVFTFMAWGWSDVISSGVHLDPVTTATASLLGQVTVTAVFGFVAMVTNVNGAGAAGGGDAAPIPPFGWPHLGLMASNGLAMVGWLAFVRAGQLGETSVFVPITSLYTFIPVILSVIFLGERMPALKVVGLLVAGAAVVAIGWPHQPPPPSATVPPSTTAMTTALPSEADRTKEEGATVSVASDGGASVHQATSSGGTIMVAVVVPPHEATLG